jgi:hypothetical protein
VLFPAMPFIQDESGNTSRPQKIISVFHESFLPHSAYGMKQPLYGRGKDVLNAKPARFFW